MNILITVCARGGSKGIPGKNIKLLNGKPLIEYTLKSAEIFSLRYNSKIAISTDDDKILSVCNSFGIHTNYRRPIELSTDTAGKIDTINDILLFEEKEKNIKYDYILDLDVTSPLRTQLDLNEAFEKLKNDSSALNIFSVNKANKNPYFNMVEQASNGYFELAKNYVERTKSQSYKFHKNIWHTINIHGNNGVSSRNEIVQYNTNRNVGDFKVKDNSPFEIYKYGLIKK